MPPKIRELISELERAGFRNRGGRGSHRNYVHPDYRGKVVLSGRLGADADFYQIRMVKRALDAVEEKEK